MIFERENFKIFNEFNKKRIITEDINKLIDEISEFTHHIQAVIK